MLKMLSGILIAVLLCGCKKDQPLRALTDPNLVKIYCVVKAGVYYTSTFTIWGSWTSNGWGQVTFDLVRADGSVIKGMLGFYFTAGVTNYYSQGYIPVYPGDKILNQELNYN